MTLSMGAMDGELIVSISLMMLWFNVLTKKKWLL